jgi:hypothetical protein
VENSNQTWTDSQQLGDFLVEESPFSESALSFGQTRWRQDVDSARLFAAPGASFVSFELAEAYRIRFSAFS